MHLAERDSKKSLFQFHWLRKSCPCRADHPTFGPQQHPCPERHKPQVNYWVKRRHHASRVRGTFTFSSRVHKSERHSHIARISKSAASAMNSQLFPGQFRLEAQASHQPQCTLYLDYANCDVEPSGSSHNESDPHCKSIKKW